MSRFLLSRIKPRHGAKSRDKIASSSPTPFTPRVKKLVDETVEILKTQDHWEDSLETHFSESDIMVSEVAHFVLDRVRDAELGLKFFDWASTRPHSGSLDSFAYSSLLKLVARSKVFSEIELSLDTMKKEDIKPSHEALSDVILSYANSGFVDKALEMYYAMRKLHNCFPNVFACNALLSGFVKQGKVAFARKLYDELAKIDDDNGGKCIDNYSTCIIVEGLCSDGKVEEGKKLIEDTWGKDCIPNVVLYNVLIDGYCKRGDIEDARNLLKHLKLKGFLPTVETYGAMIHGLCRKGKFESIDRLMKEMHQRGLNVNFRIYNSILDAQYKLGLVNQAGETVQKMIEAGCEPHISTYNIIVNASCREGKIKEASEFLEQAMKRGLVPNKYSYTPIMYAYCRQGEYVKASEFLIKMTESGETVDVVSYGAIIHGLVVAGEVDHACYVLNKMMERRVLPDAGIYNVLMSGLCKKGRFQEAKNLISEMLGQNLKLDEYVYVTLVDGLIRNQEFLEAKTLFEQTLESGLDLGVVGYNAMIKGFCKFGMMRDAMNFLHRMRVAHHSPDPFTYSTIIDGYIKQHDLRGALTMLGQMLKQKLKPNVVTYTSFINGFFRIGDSSRAERVFSRLLSCGVEANVVTYSILIGGFCKESKPAKAALFFELMLMNKCTPNDITFHYLINGFANNRCRTVFSEIVESQQQEKSIFLDFYTTMLSDGWDQRTSACNSIIVCLCRHAMVEIALNLHNKILSKGLIINSVCLASLLHGLCLQGRSKEWKTIISSNRSETELQAAVKYSLKLDNYLYYSRPSEASLILLEMTGDQSSHSHRRNLVASANKGVTLCYPFFNVSSFRVLIMSIASEDCRRLTNNLGSLLEIRKCQRECSMNTYRP